MVTSIAEQDMESMAQEVMETVRFLYPNEQYPHDEETVRAMIVLGGSVAQIRESIAIAAINTRIEREFKTRYANGVLRNLMNPRPTPVYGWDGEDEPDVDDMSGLEPPDHGYADTRQPWWRSRR